MSLGRRATNPFRNPPPQETVSNPVIPAKAGIQRGGANGICQLSRTVPATIADFAMVSSATDGVRQHGTNRFMTMFQSCKSSRT